MAETLAEGGTQTPKTAPLRTTKVFVTGLDLDTVPQTLGEYCCGIGEVRYATIFTDPETGQSNGTAKVDFDSEETAARAVAELNGSWLDGVQITVQPLELQRRENDGRQVFFGGLGYNVGEEELWAFVEPVGSATFIRIFIDRETGRSRGCGKVEFETAEIAQSAIQQLDNKELNGRRVTVELMGQDSGRRPPRRDTSTKVLVRDLGDHITAQMLGEYCQRIGSVLYANVYKDQGSGRPNGTGKVDFDSEETARRAVAELSGTWLDGCQIKVLPMSEADPLHRTGGQKRENDGRQVFFGGLGYDFGEDALSAFVSGIGGSTFVRIFLDRETGRSRGCGKVEFESVELAQRAIQELDGKELGGRPVTVELLGQDSGRRPPPPPPRRGPPGIDGRQLFLGGLSPDTDEDVLRAFCEPVGRVTFAAVFTDRETGQSKGAGKVEFESADLARRAAEELSGTTLQGRSITARVMTQNPGPRPEPASRPAPGTGPRGTSVIDGRQMFVGGLSPDTDADALRTFCSPHGRVTFATVFMDRDTGRPKGAGKVEFESTDAAERAVGELDGKVLNGRAVSVRLMSLAGAPHPAVASKKGPSVVDGRQVFVGGISPDTDADALRAFFGPSGGITYATVFMDRDTGRPKGAGKVEFETAELALSAVDAAEGRMLDGRPVTVRVMSNEERGPRPPRERDVHDNADPDCKLFVGSIPPDFSDAQLKETLGQAGEVLSAVVFTTSMGPAGRAVMATAEEAQRAISILHGSFLMERRIIVRIDSPPGERAPKPNLDSMVFVGGMSPETSTDDMRDHFARIGQVLYTNVFSDRETGKARGSGKVEFLSPALAQQAVEELDGSELLGRRLQVKLMEVREPGERPPRPLGPRPPRETDGRQLFFGALDPDLDTETLRSFCEARVGSVTYASVFVDRDTGQSKGAGKVEFETLELADRALRELDGAELRGKVLAVRRMGEERERAPPQADGRTVFIGGLSWDVGGEELKRFASQAGEVTFATVFVDRETGKSKGSGKVQFVSSEIAEQAVDELSGKQLLGREVTARLMENRPALA